MIKASLEIINSKRDLYGNCYYAFCFQDNASGKFVYGSTSGGESNIRNSLRYIKLESNEVFIVQREMKIRQFDNFIKNFEYAGCKSEDIASFILQNLKK